MTLSLALDFIVISLLVATIVYAVILNRKLAALHDSKEDLRNFLETFAASLAQAKAGVEYLKTVSYDSSKDLQDKIRQAKALRDEISFFVESGETTISKMEKVIKATRTQTQASAPPPKPANTVTKPSSTGATSAEVKKSLASQTPPPATAPSRPRKQPLSQARAQAQAQMGGQAKKAPQPRVEPRLVQALRGLR